MIVPDLDLLIFAYNEGNALNESYVGHGGVPF